MFKQKIETIRQWLDSRGGRNEDDLLWDEKKGYYVLMGNGRGGETSVYLPKNLINDTGLSV